ncbi:MAG: competence/damage-inducible protein A [Candidatus Eremiobacteraeota bacterium]|nr:competence/damage-inducible protein A [Candidatus Eremiobacteraeota bacterium]MBC5828397.1 competence/damage-inducible protein A [Candidatus Eremiobacteraeota bacterium]
MPSAEIITIGTELLLGQLVDTNSAVIARALADAGIDVHRQTSVGDNEQRIAEAIREALGRSDAVLCAGGLGPTVDDMTRAAVASATQRPLELRQELLADLERWFASVGRPMAVNNQLQAYVPQEAQVLNNPYGTAPGFAVDLGNTAVLAMPGVPRELIPMLESGAIPWLVARLKPHATIVTRVLRTIGIGESDVDARIVDLFQASTNPTIAVLAHVGQVDVKMTAKAQTREAALALIGELERKLRERLGDAIYGVDDASIEQTLGRALQARKWTLATAESCTGGLLGAMITSVPGSSSYYRGGAVSYADEAKYKLLGVAPSLIDLYGAVSPEVALAMAVGARETLRATLALAITGVAGPAGGTPEKPVGLVLIALAKEDGGVIGRELHVRGDREMVRQRAALTALTVAWRHARRD